MTLNRPAQAKKQTSDIWWDSIKFEIRSAKEALKRHLNSLKFWRNQKFEFQLENQSRTRVIYSGESTYLPAIKALLQIKPIDSEPLGSLSQNAQEPIIQVSDTPMLGALRIPLCLATIVPLNRSMEDIMATYSRSLRRSIQQLYPQYQYVRVNDIATVDRLDDHMLRPYITARHDVGAAHLSKAAVHNMALKDFGHMDVLMQGDEEVGCHLGNAYAKCGKRYWHVNRLGYPEAVFSDFKRWGDVNSINLHLALENAIQEGYDFCDYGVSMAKPGGGLIEWKRRRKGYLSVIGNPRHFYLKLPKQGSARLLWETPLFSIQGRRIHLHLGLPKGINDELFSKRYHEMGYDGLTYVYLYSAQLPSDAMLAKLEEIFAEALYKPTIVIRQVQD